MLFIEVCLCVLFVMCCMLLCDVCVVCVLCMRALVREMIKYTCACCWRGFVRVGVCVCLCLVVFVCVVCVYCVNTGVCFVCHLLCDAVGVKCLLGVCVRLCVLYKHVCCACHVCAVL